MLANDVLLQILPTLIDCIVLRRQVIIGGFEEAEILRMLPRLGEHKLESVALLSLGDMSVLKSFYVTTYLSQFTTIQSRLSDAMKVTKCIFLQGFPRCLDFSDYYTPGMRSDIDVFVPETSLFDFKNAAFAAGFDYYGFDEENIFLVTQDQSESLTAGNWANKDVTLTYLQEVSLPSDLPIQIVDCYLPYVVRNDKVFLMVSLEVHHFYTHPSDVFILENTREFWGLMNADRCGLEGTLYFNLIRLYKGVFAGEKRMRLVLDTACLLSDHKQSPNMSLFAYLLDVSPVKKQVVSVCMALATIHPLFAKLSALQPEEADFSIVREWLAKFGESLRVD